LTNEIRGLSVLEREELAHAVLPLLLATSAGLGELDDALAQLSDAELDAVVERARARRPELPDAAVAEIIGEALRAVRAARRS
jgi:hypothetical protein